MEGALPVTDAGIVRGGVGGSKLLTSPNVTFGRDWAESVALVASGWDVRCAAGSCGVVVSLGLWRSPNRTFGIKVLFENSHASKDRHVQLPDVHDVENFTSTSSTVTQPNLANTSNIPQYTIKPN